MRIAELRGALVEAEGACARLAREVSMRRERLGQIGQDHGGLSKRLAEDAKVNVSVPRSHFNELATKGHVRDWREAFDKGDAKATGIEQVMKLIVNVVEKQEERSRTRRARH